MPRFESLVIQNQRHLKWRALDPVEQGLMILCGICIGYADPAFAANGINTPRNPVTENVVFLDD